MSTRSYNARERQIIGIIPASGRAKRLSVIPCSKEILPVGIHPPAGSDPARMKAACEYVLQNMMGAGIDRIYMVIRNEKRDIPAFLESCGAGYSACLSYLVNNGTDGVPHTVDQAYPLVQNNLTALGFPDIIYEDNQSFELVAEHLEQSGADIVVGLFPTDQPEHGDLVELENTHQVRRIIIKMPGIKLEHTWGIAVWTPAFSGFLHQYIATAGNRVGRSGDPGSHGEGPREIQLGDVIQAAIERNYRVNAIKVSDEPYIDIGRIDNYFRAIRQFSSR